MRNLYKAFITTIVCAILCAPVLRAQVYPTGFAQSRVGSGLRVQVAAAIAPDGRAFVVEQSGSVRVIKNNATLPTPFVMLAVDSRGERGLLGVAVDPDFLINKYLYVYYTVPGTPARNRISRFTATNDTAAPGSETVILNLDPLSSALIHNGGALHFGKDGKLYVAVGENASTANSQNLNTYHGKLLRINKDGSIPPGNPFTSGSEQQRRIWAYGFRNPFTFAIDQETGKIFVNDVGQGAWEEINDATVGGRNFGWPTTEGYFNQSDFPNLTNPVYAYGHGAGDGVGCAIVGGAFISQSNPNYPPEYRGKYLFQDNCNDWFNILDLSGPVAVRSPFATSVTLNSLGLMMGLDGYLYFSARHHESLYKIVYNFGLPPTITNHPVSATVATGQPATLTVSALGTPPLSYQWLKNGIELPSATGATFSISQAIKEDSGEYRVLVSNTAGNVTSNVATLTVITNELPRAEILTPTSDNTYVAGATIDFSGQGTDAEDGVLPPQSMSWQINFHHNTHDHDEPPTNGISAGSFTIPQVGETSDNVWYRIILTVTDSHGFKGKDSVDVFPLKSTLQFNTVPAGLQITLDGQPMNTPSTVVSVEGVTRALGVISPQTLNSETYEFTSWTHGGQQTHNINTPVEDATYTANFTRVENSFYRAININGPALSIDGNNWQASAGAPNFSMTGAAFADQNNTLVPGTDANRASMIRSSIWYQPNVTISAVPAGTYQVWVYVWEDNFPVTYSILLEGNVVQSNYNSGGAGTWRKLGPFTATINDGNINVSSTGIDANFSGVEIWRTGQPVSLPTLATPLVDQNATVNTPFTYTFLANTFMPSQPGNALSYSASLENGAALPSWLTFNAATRTFSGTPGSSNGGTVNIRVTASEATGTANDVFALSVSGGIATATFYRAINLNGTALSIDGNNWQASAGAPNFSMTGAAFADQNNTLVPGTDANRASMIRSSIWYQPNVTISAVPAGTYQVWVYVWEDNFPVTYSILLEGNVVQSNYNSGGAGTWRKLGPFTATINDGNINVSSTGIDANFSGVEIWRTGQPVSLPTLATPLVDQNATVNTPFTYTFLANTFMPSQPGNALSYSASLENGAALPSWLTFNAATRTFSGTPGSSNGGTVNIRVTASEATGTANDVFALSVSGGIATATFYRAINLNGTALSIDGNNWQASAGAPNFSMTGAAFADQNNTLVPGTDANRASMIRSSIWYQPNVTISAVPAGTYQVWVYVWEDNFPVTYSILLEGNVVQSNYNSGGAGTWRKLGPFTATINDGNINVSSTAIDANFSGVEIWNAGQGAAGQRLTSVTTLSEGDMLPDREESEVNHDLAFYPNPFSHVATIAYTTTESGPAKVSMYDVRGQKIWSAFDKNVEKGMKESVELETSNFKDGVYVLQVINGHDVRRLKVIKVR
ncbi:MAG: PQQ-dependent sugar dehydrogenase [Chryseolinea sp.]